MKTKLSSSDIYNPVHPQITPKKPLKFLECRRTLGNKGSLTSHIHSQHREISYNCGECGVITSRRDSMKTHYEDYHENITTPDFIEKREILDGKPTYKNVRFNSKSKSKDELRTFIENWQIQH